MEPLFVDDRQLITPPCLRSSHNVCCVWSQVRVSTRAPSQYWKSSIMGYLDCQLSLYWEVSLYQSRLLMSSSTHTCQATWQVSWSPSQLTSEFPSLQEGCTQEISEFPPPLPTHLSPHWHHFSPASPRPLSLSNSELPAHIYPLTLTPPLSLDCASLISPLQISPWPLVPACKL